jgi:uncharacterized damage-inducible protein DinB
MTRNELTSQILATWRLHNKILIYLLSQIPKKGLSTRPSGSRGRDVTAQFAHLYSVRIAWLQYHRTGQRPKSKRLGTSKPPSRRELMKNLRKSGKDIELFLADACESNIRPRLFGRQVVRWIGYLISHESHHRGQIVLALKQSGMRLNEHVAMTGLWGKWIFGK